VLAEVGAMACNGLHNIIGSSWYIVLGAVIKASICLAELPLGRRPHLILRFNRCLIRHWPLFSVCWSNLSFSFNSLFLLFDTVLRELFWACIGGNLHCFIIVKPTCCLSILFFHCWQEVGIVLKSLQVILYSLRRFSRWSFFHIQVANI